MFILRYQTITAGKCRVVGAMYSKSKNSPLESSVCFCELSYRAISHKGAVNAALMKIRIIFNQQRVSFIKQKPTKIVIYKNTLQLGLAPWKMGSLQKQLGSSQKENVCSVACECFKIIPKVLVVNFVRL